MNRLSQAIRLPDAIIILVAVLIVLLSISPQAMPFVRRDSGVFLYSGWRILAGEVPYRDIWDNKPPVILYLNAAGLALGGGSRWGVWWIELLSLSAAALLGFRLLARTFGRRPALLASGLWLLALAGILSGGNYATEYTLPLQFACLWLAYESEERCGYSWRGYLIGLLCGLAFFTKQNTIGIGAAILLHLILAGMKPGRWKRALPDTGLILLGGLTSLAGCAALLAAQGVIPQFWDSAFAYNFVYASTSVASHAKSAVAGMAYLSTLTLLAFAGWGMSAIGLLRKRKILHHEDAQTRRKTQETSCLRDLVVGRELPGAAGILSIAIIGLPIEIILASLSGYSYRHYYISLLPIFTLLAGYSFWLLLAPASPLHLSRRTVTGLLAAIFAIPVATASIALARDIQYPAQRGLDYDAVTTYIESRTSPEDTVLLWGAEVEMNFASARRSPSRYIYLDPLYKPGYADEEMIANFLVGLLRDRPKLIIDTKYAATPMYEFGVSSARIEALTGELRARYRLAGNIGDWTVYAYAGE
jgi:hypothetical protein